MLFRSETRAKVYRHTDRTTNAETLVALWQNDDGSWTGELFVNGLSITRLSADFRTLVLESLKRHAVNERRSRAIAEAL